MNNKSDNERKMSKRPKVPLTFHKRFNIKIPDKNSQERFLNRVKNLIVEDFLEPIFEEEVEGVEDLEFDVMRHLANSLGKRYSYGYGFNHYVGDDFYTCLQALELVYEVLPTNTFKEDFNEIIKNIFSLSEIDLGIRWREGIFIPSGAKILDESLVNENLAWLSDHKYNSVLKPFEKGLSHYLEAKKNPNRLIDTVRDIYESLEAIARLVTGKPKRDLSKNAELFIKKLGLSKYYEKMLKDYVDYGCEFRHAVEECKSRVLPKQQEVEAFIYTSGLFIRLAIEVIEAQEAT